MKAMRLATFRALTGATDNDVDVMEREGVIRPFRLSAGGRRCFSDSDVASALRFYRQRRARGYRSKE